MHILSLDVGTTSTRGILFDDQGQQLCTESRRTLLLQADGLIEQSPATYRRVLIEICKAIRSRFPVDAISLTAFRSTPALFDADGEPLTSFIMWQDTRNHEICENLAYASADVYKKCGASINTVFTAPKLTWFQQNHPELYRRCHKSMVVPDYLLFLMTGRFVTDRTYGSRTLLMDLQTREWDSALCALFSVNPEKLCRLIEPGSVAGTVTESFAAETGIPAGIPVISAGGDQQCAALGSGVLDSSAVMVNNGTGSFVLSIIEKPCLDNPTMICNVAAIADQYIAEANILSSAASLNWLAELLFPAKEGEETDFDALNAAAADSPIGANGLYCLPHFQGRGTCDWNPGAKAAFTGLTLQSTRGDMLRALYEGLAAEIAKSLRCLPSPCPDAENVYISGGLSQSRVFNTILASMLNKKLTLHQNIQATAIGAYASAAVALGLYGGYRQALAQVRKHESPGYYLPQADAVSFYHHYQERTEDVYQAIAGKGNA